MSEITPSSLSRRSVLKRGGQAAAASALAGVSIPHVHAAEDNTIKIALVGCGGRGTGAAVNALSVPDDLGPLKLVAMGDVFDSKLESSYETLSNPKKPEIAARVDVPKERRFVGFDAYKKCIDMLRPGDLVICATPPAFRWVFFDYAIQKGINLFMEKPLTIDGPTTKRILELNEKAQAKNLKVGIGLMCRHCDARRELVKRIRDGEIGDITMLRAYRMQGPIGSAFSRKNPGEMSDLLYQIKNFHGFLWLSGGAFSDFLIHNIDECCWMKGDFPVEAKGMGGRHYREDYIDQNFDHYHVEYTFADGTKLFLDGRNMQGCHNEFASYAHGTKGSAIISASSHSPARCRTYKGHKIPKNWKEPTEDLAWEYPQEPPEANPYEREWEHLIGAIRRDEVYNEVRRGAMASLVTSMGRMAAHTGQVITYDQILNGDHEFGPGIDQLTMDSDSPLVPNPDGSYPIPEPGKKKDREY